MRQQSREYITVLFVGAGLAINYPLLELFNRPVTLFGIPLLYFYLYCIWLVLIIVLIIVVERSEVPEPEEPLHPTNGSTLPQPSKPHESPHHE